MTENSHTLYSAKINNNCPECFDNTGLELSFSQLERENKFYAKFDSKVTSSLHCSKCETNIYPVSWDEDIERVHEYHSKLVQKKSAAIKLKPLAYILILVDVITIAALIYFLK